MTGDGTRLRVHRPQDGAPIGELRVSSPEEVREALVRVREVQAGWASLAPEDRARRMAGLRAEIDERVEEIADRVVTETGKPDLEALREVLAVQSLLRFLEKRGPAVLGHRGVDTRWMFWKRAWSVREPYGVIGVLTPGSHPFLLGMEPVVTALFGGNGVVLKPSRRVPFTGALVPELVAGAGLPEDLVRAVHGGPETGRDLVESGVDRVHFTGGPEVAREVLAAAAPGLVPVTLHLGRRPVGLVLPDADLDRAARGVVYGAFFDAGQSPFATGEVFVMDEVYDALLRRVKKLASNLRAGSGGRIDVGPVKDERRLERLERTVAEAERAGARIVCGGRRADPASNVFLPTVLADLTPDMTGADPPPAGPLVSLVRVRDVDEALAAVNPRFPPALSVSVWTDDPSAGASVGRRFRAGGVYVNDTLSHWGIPDLSGGGGDFGRARGEEALRELTRVRSIVQQRSRLKRDPWWFPYGPSASRWARGELAGEGRSGVRRITAAIAGFLRGDRP